jgi:hypothetical protein
LSKLVQVEVSFFGRKGHTQLLGFKGLAAADFLLKKLPNIAKNHQNIAKIVSFSAKQNLFSNAVR